MGNINEEWLVFKNEGNEHFKQNQMKEAVDAYSKGIKICQNETDKMVLYKNRSACYLKMECYQEAIQDADVVITIQPRDMKALFRRYKILFHLFYFLSILENQIEVIKKTCAITHEELLSLYKNQKIVYELLHNDISLSFEISICSYIQPKFTHTHTHAKEKNNPYNQ